MTEQGQTTFRRLGPGDEDVIRRLATRDPQAALLADERTIFIAAFLGDDPVGFVFGYLLPRRHGHASMLFVYELEVDGAHRRQGIGTRLLTELLGVGRSLGAGESFVLTEPDNGAANALYRRLGAQRSDVVEWDW